MKFHAKRMGVLAIPFKELKNAVLVRHRVFSLSGSTVRAFAVPSGVLSQKKNDRRLSDALELAPQILSHAHKTGPWYLLGVLFKSYDQLPFLFMLESPSPRSKSEYYKQGFWYFTRW